MSLLLDRPPNAVTICGQSYPIRSDYRYGILFEMLCLDTKLTNQEKSAQALQLMFPDVEHLPFEHPQEIVDAMLWFYHGGNRPLNLHQIGERRKAERQADDRDSHQESKIYDYDFDDELICAAFLQQYGIDLIDIRHLHWWKYRALFAGLTEDTKFMKVLGYRTAKITSKMSAAEKKALRKMKDIYALPVPLDEAEKADQIADALQSGDVAAVMRLIVGGGDGN